MKRTVKGFVFNEYVLDGLNNLGECIVSEEMGRFIKTELKHMISMILKETVESIVEHGRYDKEERDYFYVSLDVDIDVWFSEDEPSEKVKFNRVFYDSEMSSAAFDDCDIRLSAPPDPDKDNYEVVSAGGLRLRSEGIINNELEDDPIIFLNEVVVKMLCYDSKNHYVSIAGANEVLCGLEYSLKNVFDCFSDTFLHPEVDNSTFDAYKRIK